MCISGMHISLTYMHVSYWLSTSICPLQAPLDVPSVCREEGPWSNHRECSYRAESPLPDTPVGLHLASGLRMWPTSLLVYHYSNGSYDIRLGIRICIHVVLHLGLVDTLADDSWFLWLSYSLSLPFGPPVESFCLWTEPTSCYLHHSKSSSPGVILVL